MNMKELLELNKYEDMSGLLRSNPDVVNEVLSDMDRVKLTNLVAHGPEAVGNYVVKELEAMLDAVLDDMDEHELEYGDPYQPFCNYF